MSHSFKHGFNKKNDQKYRHTIINGYQRTKTDKSGRITTYVYDGLGRLVSEEEKLVGQTLFKAEYTFFVLREIAKDAYLLENHIVESVEWHFFESAITGMGGPSGPLLELLLENGFSVIFH